MPRNLFSRESPSNPPPECSLKEKMLGIKELDEEDTETREEAVEQTYELPYKVPDDLH